MPGIEPVLAAAGLRPDQVSGFIEAVLMDWSGEYEHPRFPSDYTSPAAEACHQPQPEPPDERRNRLWRIRAHG